MNFIVPCYRSKDKAVKPFCHALNPPGDNLRALRDYHAMYKIPIGAQVIPVWKPGA
jgi:hypothetical protein